MTSTVLQIAAFVCVGTSVVLLVLHFTGPAMSQAARVMRFRRKLNNLDGVLVAWELQMRQRAGDEPLLRRLSPPRVEERRVTRPGEEPEAGAAA